MVYSPLLSSTASLSLSDLWSRLWFGILIGKAASTLLVRVLSLPEVIYQFLDVSFCVITLVSTAAVCTILALAVDLVSDASRVPRLV